MEAVTGRSGSQGVACRRADVAAPPTQQQGRPWRHIGPCGKQCGSGPGPCDGHFWDCNRIMPLHGHMPLRAVAPVRVDVAPLRVDYVDAVGDPMALPASPAVVDGLGEVRPRTRVRR